MSPMNPGTMCTIMITKISLMKDEEGRYLNIAPWLLREFCLDLCDKQISLGKHFTPDYWQLVKEEILNRFKEDTDVKVWIDEEANMNL